MPSVPPDHSGTVVSAAATSSGERRGGLGMGRSCRAGAASFQGPAAREAWRGVERGPSSAVQPALDLVLAGPAPGAWVLALRDRAGARRAADGGVTDLLQGVDRYLVLGDVGVHVVLGP